MAERRPLVPSEGNLHPLNLPPIAQPSSYLRPRQSSKPSNSKQMSPVDRDQLEALRQIRGFLKKRNAYDVLPLSFRLIVFDTTLLVKKSLNILNANDIVSAPLWDSAASAFAGMLTCHDYLNVIQYYWQHPESVAEIDKFRLSSLRDIERAIGVPPIETVSIHPDKSVFEACMKMVQSRARRIPIIDEDDETQRSMVVSVITQYRILKFIGVNVDAIQMLGKTLKEIGVGTFGADNIATAHMHTPVIEVIHLLVKYGISSVPILDNEGTVLNAFEAVDIIQLIQDGVSTELDMNVGEALLKRRADHAGIYTCSETDDLLTIFDRLRKSRVHRFIMVDEKNKLQGVLALSDVLEYCLTAGVTEEDEA